MIKDSGSFPLKIMLLETTTNNDNDNQKAKYYPQKCFYVQA